MPSLINAQAVETLITDVLKEDMNKCLEAVTKEVVAKLENQVRANVAARMIALAHSDYSMEYMHGELHIKVKMETKRC